MFQNLFFARKPSAASRRHSLKILVIDDDPEIFKCVATALNRLGAEVMSARNGWEGLQTVKKESPDLIILDASMPVLDGFAACKRLKADPTTQCIPILMLTARGMGIPILDRAFRSGVEAFLTKPYENHELIEKVQHLLNLRSAR